MKKLVELDTALDALKDVIVPAKEIGFGDESTDGYNDGINMAVTVLSGLPTVDAVPVVRCKDCMHYGFTDNRIPEEQVWWCYFWDDVRSPDAYCSDGERKDDDHEKAD